MQQQQRVYESYEDENANLEKPREPEEPGARDTTQPMREISTMDFCWQVAICATLAPVNGTAWRKTDQQGMNKERAHITPRAPHCVVRLRTARQSTHRPLRESSGCSNGIK
eukprot:scaffold29097_cov31-Tisochrysis_lutea.AAC.5